MGKDRIIGFTLAEVLITLAIIGVVSAIVIPTVVKNYNGRKYNTARLKALKTFGDAGKLASINNEMNGQPDAESFVNNVLSKYLKITKTCTLDNPNDCGFPSQIQPSNPATAKKSITKANMGKWNQVGNISTVSKVSSPTGDNKMSAIISTNDGFSAIVYYNPKCGRTNHEITFENNCRFKECGFYAMDAACMNVVYDMNGVKGPNHVGEDIGFVTTFWSGLNAISVAPGILPYNEAKAIYDEEYLNWANAQKKCANKGSSKVPYTLPSLYEMDSLTLNLYIDSLPYGNFWSGAPVADRPGFSWNVYYAGNSGHDLQTGTYGAWCLRR